MAAADYRLLTEATGQRIAAALEALSGTGAAAAAARTNLDVYSKGETDTAIAQSTADINLSFGTTDDTWAKIYAILSQLSLGVSAFFLAQGPASNVLTNAKYTSALKGIVNYASGSNGMYDFIAYTGTLPQYIWVWRISGLTSASATPTVSTVYRFNGTAL